MNKPTIIITIFVVLTVLIAWQYFLPAFNKVMELRGELATWQGKLNDTQALGRKLESLKKKYDAMTNDIARVEQAVPLKEDLPGLLVQFEQLASQNGLILNDVSFATPELKKAKKAALASEDANLGARDPAAITAMPDASAQKGSSSGGGAKTLAVDLSLTGSQNSLKSFLKSVEENLRLMDISAFGFSSGLSGGLIADGNTAQDFRVALNTYFRE